MFLFHSTTDCFEPAQSAVAGARVDWERTVISTRAVPTWRLSSHGPWGENKHTQIAGIDGPIVSCYVAMAYMANAKDRLSVKDGEFQWFSIDGLLIGGIWIYEDVYPLKIWNLWLLTHPNIIQYLKLLDKGEITSQDYKCQLTTENHHQSGRIFYIDLPFGGLPDK